MQTRLWRIPIVEKNTPTTQLKVEYCYANAAVQLSTPDYTVHLSNSVYDCNTQHQLIRYYHAALFSPTKKTLTNATRRGYLQGWPGLTQAAINNQLENSEAMIKGHLNQVRKGVRSTPATEEEEIEQNNEETNYLFASIADL
eukprot:11552517-Ditylum_brightwellii.AAC.1